MSAPGPRPTCAACSPTPRCSDRKEGPMAYAYDDQNVFAKILRGEIPNRTVLET
jgi:hypothetical protein